MQRLVVWALCLMFSTLAGQPAAVFYLTDEGANVGITRHDLDNPISALNALSTLPASDALYGDLQSGIPAGTRVTDLFVDGEDTVIEFSPEILQPELDETRLSQVFEQVRLTLWQFGVQGSLRLQSGGKLLSDYLPPAPVIAPRPGARYGLAAAGTGALAGKSISLSPGHGKVWTGSSYAFERPVYCSPLSREDDHNLEIMQYLNQYITQDGGVTKVYRCLDKNFGTHTPSAEPWWRISAGYWLKQNGYPCSVYASSTGDCNLGTGASESGDSLRSRGLASDYDNTDIYVSLHSNGASGDCSGSGCPNGTCTYYDASSEHASWATISSNLAYRVNTSIVNVIRNRYGDASWSNRGALNANGSQAETRIPNRAAILIELAFHDSCDRDAAYLRDNFFRSATMWASYKGICDYFGVTPTWDFYSCEIVSDTIPAVMTPGASANVTVTLRNRGVLWNDAKLFRLGAVADSDPFTTTTRYNVGTEVGPGSTRTFAFTLKAPATQGIYTTDWQMVREGVSWFGPVLSRNILVSTNGDTQAPSTPSGLIATAPSHSQVQLRWNPATDNLGVNSYKIFRNSILLGTSLTTNYTDNSVKSGTAYAYQVSALDAANNESSRSPETMITTPWQLEFTLDNLDGTALGTWQTGTSSSDKWLTDYRFSSTVLTENSTFHWVPPIEQPGFYSISVFYPMGSNRSTNAPYKIVHAGGQVVVGVNQTTRGGQWVSLGATRPFIRGTNGWVQLGNGTADTGKVVMADAVRFTYFSALPALPKVQTSLSGQSLTLTWNNTYAMLQQATLLTTGAVSWTDLPQAKSPFTVNAAAGLQKYYRLRY